MNEQNNTQIIVISVIITALIVGGGVYAWQRLNLKSTEQNLQQQITNLQDKIVQLQKVQLNQNMPSDNEPTPSTPNQDGNESAVNTIDSKTPRIISATFDGNGVVIQGERLAGSYVAFSLLNNPSLKGFCRELITPECVLQKSLSTDNTIKFISNWIGGKDTYKLYVENPTAGKSNEVSFTIK